MTNIFQYTFRSEDVKQIKNIYSRKHSICHHDIQINPIIPMRSIKFLSFVTVGRFLEFGFH